MVYKLIDGRPMMPPENGVLRDGRAVSGYRNLLVRAGGSGGGGGVL